MTHQIRDFNSSWRSQARSYASFQTAGHNAHLKEDMRFARPLSARDSRPNTARGLRVRQEHSNTTKDLSLKLPVRLPSTAKPTGKNTEVDQNSYTSLANKVGAIRITDDPVSARNRADPYVRKDRAATNAIVSARGPQERVVLEAPRNAIQEEASMMQTEEEIMLARSPERMRTCSRVKRSFLMPEDVGSYAIEYEENIVEISMGKEECAIPPMRNYIDSMSYINRNQREVLISWVVDTHAKWKLSQETLFLTVSFIDRFMALKSSVLTTQYLQLAGAVCLNICSKYEDIMPFCLKDVSDLRPQWTKDDIALFEAALITDMQFRVTAPTPLFFLKYFIRVALGPEDTFNEKEALLAQYLSTIALHCSDVIADFKPSIVAGAALYLARKRCNTEPVWPERLQKASKFSPTDPECSNAIKLLHNFWQRVCKETGQKRPARPTFHRFALKTYLRVALLECPSEPQNNFC